MTIRVLQVGLGPIGAEVARQLVQRRGLELVGAVDIDPGKIGRDAGEVLAVGRPLGVPVTGAAGRTIRACKPDIAVVCTSSQLDAALPLFEEILARQVPIVTTTEEAAYPSRANRRLARRLDAAARAGGAAILGTGVNPGFTMDALPIALTAVCERVDRIEVHRVQDARVRRLPFQQKIGAGLTPAAFQRKVEEGSVRHVGFNESVQMIADAIGWPLTTISERVTPKIADRPIAGERLSVEPGLVCGIVQEAIGWSDGAPRITLRLEAYLGAEQPYEAILIEGSPRIHSRIDGGIHGDVATASMTVNAIPAVIAAPPGLHTMRDLRLPSFFPGHPPVGG